MSSADIVIIAIAVIGVAAGIIIPRIRKKRGKGCCSCGCQDCIKAKDCQQK